MINKQEVIEKIEKEKSNLNAWEDLTRNRALDDALAIVRKLDEPEKPVVPQFVADWIVVCKENLALSLATAMNPIVLKNNNQSEKTINWFKSPKNQETFAKAWLYGYEVEKEKLYTVEFPNPNRADVSLVLGVYNGGKVAMFANYTDNWKYKEQYQLTEAEIKKDFDWAWQFAKEVEEVEE